MSQTLRADIDHDVNEIRQICRQITPPCLASVGPNHHFADDYKHSVVIGPRHDVMRLIGEVANAGIETLRSVSLV
jgi:hypothetical protein